MKKKRFMRLVMSYGVQRNEAARIAARIGAFGSYEALFTAYCPLLAGRATIQGLQRGLRNFSETVALADRGLCGFFTAAFGGVDLAAGEDQSVVVHHVQSGSGAPSVQAMAREEHEATHAAGRKG